MVNILTDKGILPTPHSQPTKNQPKTYTHNIYPSQKGKYVTSESHPFVPQGTPSRTKFSRRGLLVLRNNTPTSLQLQKICANVNNQLRSVHPKRVTGKARHQAPDFVPYLNTRTNQVRYFKRSPVLLASQNIPSDAVNEKVASFKVYCENGKTLRCVLVAKRDTTFKTPCIGEINKAATKPPDQKNHKNHSNPRPLTPKFISQKKVFSRPCTLNPPMVPIKQSAAQSPPICGSKKRPRYWYHSQQLGRSKRHRSDARGIFRDSSRQIPGKPLVHQNTLSWPRKRRLDIFDVPFAMKILKQDAFLTNSFTKFDRLNQWSELTFSETAQEQSPNHP